MLHNGSGLLRGRLLHNGSGRCRGGGGKVLGADETFEFRNLLVLAFHGILHDFDLILKGVYEGLLLGDVGFVSDYFAA
jgi:hypothetical protein